MPFPFNKPTNSLPDLIRQKQSLLAEAEAEVARLKQDLLDARTALLGEQPVWGPLNSTQMAHVVLCEASGPMHVNDMLSAIEARFSTQVRFATLVANLSRLVGKKKLFTRVGPNTFALLDGSIAPTDVERERI